MVFGFCFCFLSVRRLLLRVEQLPLRAGELHVLLRRQVRLLLAQLGQLHRDELVVGRGRALGLVLVVLGLLRLLREQRLDVLGRLAVDVVRVEHLVDRGLGLLLGLGLGLLLLRLLGLGVLLLGLGLRLRLGLGRRLLLGLGLLLLRLRLVVLVGLVVLVRVLGLALGLRLRRLGLVLGAVPQLVALLEADNPLLAVLARHLDAHLLGVGAEAHAEGRHLLAGVGRLGRVLAGHLRGHFCL